jgi:hypothetical protein
VRGLVEDAKYVSHGDPVRRPGQIVTTAWPGFRFDEASLAQLGDELSRVLNA